MIEAEKIRIRNFQSYGNNWTEFNFKQGVNKLSGETGEGKSSITEAVYFACFGKPYRKFNLPDLINSINKKETEVHYFFNINSVPYRIERGLKPNYLRMYKNDVIVPVPSSSRSYQEIIEQDHLKTTPNIFEQVSYKSLTKNSSFLTLTKDKKREVVEPMLNIQLYTSMNKLAKLKVDALDKEIASLNKDMNYTDVLITQEKDHLLRLKQLKDERTAITSAKIDEINSQIVELQEGIDKKTLAVEKIQKYKTKKTELSNEVQTLKNQYREIEQKLKNIDVTLAAQETERANQGKKIQFLQKTCGTCSKIKAFEEEMNRPADNTIILKEQTILKEQLAQKETEIRSFQPKIDKCQEYINMERGFQEAITSGTRQIANLKKQIQVEKDQEIKIDDSKLKGYIEQKKQLGKNNKDKAYDKIHYAYGRTLLTDDKIKAFVVKKYLPSINKFLSLYLQKFGADVLFRFDEEWNEEFLTRHKENFKYESLSEGQKRISDLAIIFAFISFCNLKYSQSASNLLILDEVGTGLDKNLQNTFYEILKEFTAENKKCTMIMSHNDVPVKYIDNHYFVKRVGGFSTIEEI